MKITLVRHSEVIESYQHCYNGLIDIGLSLNGKQQAKKIAEELNNIIFEKVYCSDLKRAKQTLDMFSLNLEPIYTKELREKSWGIHEGKSFEEIEKSGIKYENFYQWITALDGENIQNYIKRIERYFKEIIFKQDCENILIITHSGVIKTLLSIMNGIELEEAFSNSLPYSSYITLEI